MSKKNPRLTKAGAILLAKAIAGNQLTFLRGALGDAAGSEEPTDKQIDNLTALLHEKKSLPIVNFRIENNQGIVTCLVKNEDLTEGFRVAEGGIFAYDAENDVEVLYSYFYDGDEGEYLPATDGEIQLEYEYEFITAVSNAANVICKVDKSLIGVTLEEFEAHINSAEPHPNLDHVTHPELNTHINSTNPHPNFDHVTHPELNSHIESTEPHPNLDHVTHPELNSHVESTLPHPNCDHVTHAELSTHSLSTDPHPNWKAEVDVESRLKQIEINQANLYILLESVHKFGVQGNLILLEDFQTLADTQLSSVNATIEAIGKDVLVDDLAYLRDSNFAVVSDGLIYNQAVTLDSISKTADGYILTAAKNLKDTTKRGKLYRTTMTIKDDKAYGAGLVKVRRQSANKMWKGEGIAETAQVTFNAYPSLESSFTLDGDWSLTADGYFTLD